MIRQAPRLLRLSKPSLRFVPPRRFLSIAPPSQKSRSWRSSAVRWGLALGVVYYYNTSELFAEEPPYAVPPPQTPSDETSLHTLESFSPSRRKQETSLSPSPSTGPTTSISTLSPTPATKQETIPTTPLESSASPSTSKTTIAASPDLEATHTEASQEGAYNEETGEINWDCPCLGGMAHGPCGEEFRGAFSCFVHSTDDPKGMDCIPNFKTMQDCFRQHPEIYGSELEEGDDDDSSLDPPIDEADSSSSSPSNYSIPTPSPSTTHPDAQSTSPSVAGDDSTHRAQAAKTQIETDHADEPLSESEALVPKAAHDARAANADVGR